jgi:ribonuclease D
LKRQNNNFLQETRSTNVLKNKPRGLSKLTMEIFGKPLDKSECMSNWANNPLRAAQLKYAALDSFVLIQIHDFFQKRIKELEIEFDYINRSSLL